MRIISLTASTHLSLTAGKVCAGNGGSLNTDPDPTEDVSCFVRPESVQSVLVVGSTPTDPRDVLVLRARLKELFMSVCIRASMMDSVTGLPTSIASELLTPVASSTSIQPIEA
jgi:hypothetical protein